MIFVAVGAQAQIGNPAETDKSFFRILHYGTVLGSGAVLEAETVKRVSLPMIS